LKRYFLGQIMKSCFTLLLVVTVLLGYQKSTVAAVIHDVSLYNFAYVPGQNDVHIFSLDVSQPYTETYEGSAPNNYAQMIFREDPLPGGVMFTWTHTESQDGNAGSQASVNGSLSFTTGPNPVRYAFQDSRNDVGNVHHSFNLPNQFQFDPSIGNYFFASGEIPANTLINFNVGEYMISAGTPGTGQMSPPESGSGVFQFAIYTGPLRDVFAVPEPSSLALLVVGVGGVGLAVSAYRRRRVEV
jgi:hypothetical protein